MFFMGREQCLRTFADSPDFPTAVVLRQHMRARDPDHWALKSFDKRYPAHDEQAQRNGRTKLGELPLFTPSASLMSLLLAKGLPTKEQERLQRERDKAIKAKEAKEQQQPAAAFPAAAATSSTAAAAPSSSARMTREDDWGAPAAASEVLTYDDADPYAQPQQQNAATAADQARTARQEAARMRREKQQLAKQLKQQQQQQPSLQPDDGGFAWASDNGSNTQRKRKVRYNSQSHPFWSTLRFAASCSARSLCPSCWHTLRIAPLSVELRIRVLAC
jgi:hypothetical protein